MADMLNFDATGVPPSTPFEPVPNGKYRAHIIESEVKPTKTPGGKYLQLVWEILDGDFKGRKVWDRLNIVNPNATAQEIAQRSLSAICHATDVLKVSNSQQLHNKPVMIKVVVKQDAGYDPRNDVKGYDKVDSATSTAAPTTAANVPAWAQKKAS